MGRVFPCIVCTFENMPSIISNFNLFFLNSFLELAVQYGQDLKKREFKDQSWLGLKTRSRDPTLSRHKGININELYLHTRWFPHIRETIKMPEIILFSLLMSGSLPAQLGRPGAASGRGTRSRPRSSPSGSARREYQGDSTRNTRSSGKQIYF